MPSVSADDPASAPEDTGKDAGEDADLKDHGAEEAPDTDQETGEAAAAEVPKRAPVTDDEALRARIAALEAKIEALEERAEETSSSRSLPRPRPRFPSPRPRWR